MTALSVDLLAREARLKQLEAAMRCGTLSVEQARKLGGLLRADAEPVPPPKVAEAPAP